MSSSRRLSKQFEGQQKRLLAQQEELFNLEEGEDEAIAMEEDEDDEHKRQRASHSRRVMEVNATKFVRQNHECYLQP
ncbi:hypothetical protein ACFX2I_030847 [Malus domestica]